MIEVEKNFKLKAGDKERLVAGAMLLEKKTFTDVYYDSNEYELTGKDFWLRSRNGRFELKVPLNTGHILNRVTDRYRELETDKEIGKVLGLTDADDLAKAIFKKGYLPFATITTARERYQKGDFHLDFDDMDFGFSAFEIELMVKTTQDIAAAKRRILEFASGYGLVAVSAGKVIEYLRRFKPKHLAFLKSVNVA